MELMAICIIVGTIWCIARMKKPRRRNAADYRAAAAGDYRWRRSTTNTRRKLLFTFDNVTSGELEELRQTQINPPGRWPARFSCNKDGAVWPYMKIGLTPKKHRIPLKNRIYLLDEIVEFVIEETQAMGKYPLGGEFEVNEREVRLIEGYILIAKIKLVDDEEYSPARAR